MICAFRELIAADAATVLSFMRDFYAVEHIEFDEGASRAALEQLLNDSSLGEVWLIDDGVQDVGYFVLTLGFSLEFRGRDAILDEIYLSPSARGRSFSTQAIEFALERCRLRGIGVLHLEVGRTNHQAQEIYRRRGFVDHDRYLMTRRTEDDGERF